MPTAGADVIRLETLAELAEWRAAQSGPVHFVPTMGNLHAGHRRLLARARADGAAVIASIYVNPTQFAPGEDYARYPRTLAADLEALAAEGCNALWLPDDRTMYPLGREQRFRLAPPADLAECLCGTRRQGHFHGVADIVMRLFWQVRPTRAVFGEKDWQQLTIIRRMVKDFSMPIEIDSVATEREADGLALSSRNRYLDADQRRIAPQLHRVLADTAQAAAEGGDTGTFSALERSAMERLDQAGFAAEYVEFRDADSLKRCFDGRLRLFAAAQLGPARLIDNVAVTRQISR